MSAVIRRAGADDAPAVQDCVVAAYSKYVERIGKEPAPMLEDYAVLIEAGGVWALVDGEEVLGTLVVRPESDHLFVGSVAVRPDRQGEGLGRELMDFSEVKAVEAGLPEVRLYTNEKMWENLRFYGSLGFEETGRRLDGGYRRVFLRKRVYEGLGDLVTEEATARDSGARGKVWFIGAGPGAPDLLTLRGARLIGEADAVVWARSLVHEGVLEYASPGAEIFESTDIPLEGVRAFYERAAREGLKVARVHSGDPSIYGAVLEQIALCEELGLAWEMVPGVSSLGAAAAAIGRELTVPEVSQSVIITRRASRTPMPNNEDIKGFAAHGTTMAIFLSAAKPRALQEDLLEGGYAPDTPCAVVYRASWPDEKIIECRLEELADRIREAGFTRQALILVGPGLAAGGTRSHLYDPAFSHSFRKAETLRPEPTAEPLGKGADAS